MSLSYGERMALLGLDKPAEQVMEKAYRDEIIDNPRCELTKKGRELLEPYKDRIEETADIIIGGAFERAEGKKLSHLDLFENSLPYLLFIWEDKESELMGLARQNTLFPSGLYAGIGLRSMEIAEEKKMILNTGEECPRGEIWELVADKS